MSTDKLKDLIEKDYEKQFSGYSEGDIIGDGDFIKEFAYQIAQKYAEEQRKKVIEEMWELLNNIPTNTEITDGYAGFKKMLGEYPSGKTWIGWFLDKYTKSLKK